MNEEAKGRSARRKRGRFDPLRWWAKLRPPIPLVEFLIGLGSGLLVASLLIGYQFQSIPEYAVGDIADRTIEAPHDFTVEDVEATLEKRERTRGEIPVVFNLDLRVNQRIESEMRQAFATGRQLLEQKQAELGLESSRAFPEAVTRELLAELRRRLPRFNQGAVLPILLAHSFSRELEDQLVTVVLEAMKPPGVVLSREVLLRYQDRGIVLRNAITEQDEPVSDWTLIRDVGQAHSLLRQNEYELTALAAREKREILEFLDTWVVPNVYFNEEATEDLESLALRDVDPVLIQVKKGKTIVRAGDEITPVRLMQLQALRQLKQPRRLFGKFLGVLLLTLFFLFVIWNYFRVQPSYRKKRRAYALLTLLVMIGSLMVTRFFVLVADLMVGNYETLQNPSHLYLMVPFALGGILVVLLIDSQLALLFALVYSALVGLMTASLPVSLYALTGNLLALHILRQYRERSAILRSGLLIGCGQAVCALALQLYASTGGLETWPLLLRSGSSLVGGLLAAVLASPLLPILEALFEITTDIKLLELSNLNNPILRRLALEAPGTYHHSIMVGTLGEAAAEAIGANSLLVRVGAYYHDIGKLRKPDYYVENQIYSGNKHDSLSPSMSSLVLASHVKEGLAMAEEIKLVPEVRDLIPQHHGTRLMTYFFQKAKDAAEAKQETVQEEDFRYPGPKPQSKEAAILMLADQVEAASRTLQDPSPGQIRSLIRRLIQGTLQDGQFDECEITLKDLDQIAKAFERVLVGMHHHRIEYPGFEFKQQQVEKEPSPHQRIQ